MKFKQALITNKPNTLTDSKDGVISKLSVRKLMNVLSYFIEENMSESMVIPLIEIKKLLKINSNEYVDLIIAYLEDLQNNEISLRNFKYKNKEYKWIKASIITNMAIYKDNNQLFLQINIANEILEGLKQKKNFTPIDLNIANQFKSIYALKIYELYKRWENHRKHEYENGYAGGFDIAYDEAQEYFGTKFNYPSKYKEAFNRGIREIKCLIGVDIEVYYIKRTQIFSFFWNKLDNEELQNTKILQKYVRQNYVNQIIFKYTQKNNKEIQLSVNKEGKLYNQLDTAPIKVKKAQELWQWLYKNQSKWRGKQWL